MVVPVSRRIALVLKGGSGRIPWPLLGLVVLDICVHPPMSPQCC